MSILKSINKIRKKIMQSLTKNIGNTQLKDNIEIINPKEVKTILICRPNHRLGNLLLITPLVQEVSKTFPNAKIDLFVKGNLASIVFKTYSNIDKIMQLPKKHFKNLDKYFLCWFTLKKKRYDIVINVDLNSSSGRLSTKFSRAKFKFFGGNNNELQLKYTDYEHIAKKPVYNLRNYLSKMGIPDNESQIPLLDLKLSNIEIAQGKELLREMVKNDLPVICLYTYATGIKCYSESWWLELYEKIKKKYTNYNIIEVLPIENISKIEFKAPTFYSKDIREIGYIIANTSIFIGADSGMMHLASSTNVPIIGLFSITELNWYKPYGNKSLAINTNEMNSDEIICDIDKLLK